MHTIHYTQYILYITCNTHNTMHYIQYTQYIIYNTYNAHTHTYNTYTHTYIHTHTYNTYAQFNMYIQYIHTIQYNTYIHTHIHTYIQYIHIYILLTIAIFPDDKCSSRIQTSVTVVSTATFHFTVHI